MKTVEKEFVHSLKFLCDWLQPCRKKHSVEAEGLGITPFRILPGF